MYIWCGGIYVSMYVTAYHMCTMLLGICVWTAVCIYMWILQKLQITSVIFLV